MSPDEPHALYRFYGAGGTLLYIGITNSIPARLKAHNKDKAWWLGVTNITVEHYPNRAAVLEAEKRAIRAEKPLYNEVHNPTPLRPDEREEWTEYYLDQLRAEIGEEIDRRIEDERFLETPEESIALAAATALACSRAEDLSRLQDAVDEFIAALPAGARDYLQQVVDRNRVSLDDREFQPGFLSTIQDWLTLQQKACEV